MTSGGITVLVADDHPLVRAGVAAFLGAAADVTVVAQAASGEEAVALAVDLRPDVVLMDLSMPGAGGVAATRQLTAAVPASAVVVLTSFHDPDRVREALAAGAVGFLLKDADPQVVLDGVRAAAAGGAPLDPRSARVLLPTPTPSTRPASGLTDREREVLALLATGLANKQIGARLGISDRTVKAHVGAVFRAIGVQDRTSAALWARDRGGY